MYKHLFGPVPSRRLGMSLGVELIPHKICSLNCVYCECGSTTKLTAERKEWVPVRNVKTELINFFENNLVPDYITFSGAGEPTLNSGVGELIEFIKNKWSNIPIAVLTNGSLLNRLDVRRELLNADIVLPSLDAASKDVFLKIDRPHPSIIITEYIEGLIQFREDFSGEIWLEVLILPGFNDSLEELDLLKEAFLEIRPDRIQINSLDRPGAVNNLRSANRMELDSIKEYWDLENVEVIAAAPDRKEIKSYRQDSEAAIIETIARRPCTLQDLSGILGLHINEVNKYLGVLQSENKISFSRQDRGLFYHLVK
jgi:wyosine [tRNA(Phe)-imidazoG37] synthetase (radical SAM superfamily)